MQHVVLLTDGEPRTFQDGSIVTYDVQLTPLGVRVLGIHKLSADQQISVLYPWQSVLEYKMVGDPNKMVKANGS